MRNLNPLYENIFLAAPGMDLNNNPTDALSLASKWALGAGSKYLKDTRLVKRIMAQYPDPMQFKARLAQLPIDNARKNALLASLQPGISQQDYAKLLRRYVCHGTLGRYLWHAWGHAYSGLANAVDAVDNETKDVDTAIASNI